MSRMLKVGVIGLGHWGPNVVRNFLENPRVRLTGVCDISEATFQSVSKLIPSYCQKVTKPLEIIKSEEVDAVAIVTPTPSHYELVKAAIQAGKHVLCEKPLTMDVGQSEELCLLAEEKGVHLMVGYTFLFNNAIKKVKEIIKENLLGKLYYLSAKRTHMGLIRSSESVVWDLAPHDVSIMNHLMEESPVRVSAVGSQPLGTPFFDVGFINLFYPSGVAGHIQVSWVDSNKDRRVEVIGSHARVLFDDLNNLEPVRLFKKGVGISNQVEPNFGVFNFLLRDGDIISPKIDIKEPLAQMIERFVAMILDKKDNPSGGTQVINITKVLVAIEKSMGMNGTPVDI